MENHPNYADGLRDGKIQALEQITSQQGRRLDDHSDRLRIIERIIWALAGIIAFVQLWPQIQRLLT